MRVLGVPGSLRRHSYNRGLLLALAEAAPPGVAVDVFAALGHVPPFSEDHETDPEPFGLLRWRRALREADVVVFATPEYNTTIPGQLKNAVDWASRPVGEEAALWGKPAAVLSSSPTGYGAMWAARDLRKALAKAGARVLEPELSVPHIRRLAGDDGTITDVSLRRRVARFLDAVLAAHAQHAAEATPGDRPRPRALT
jgi:chromate reductase